MNRYSKHLGSLLAAGVFLGLLGVSACVARGSVRYYDPVYGRYHNWNRHESDRYRQWEMDTHRRDEDFSRRSQQEQDDYWRWRHQQGDGDNGGGQS